MVLQLIAKKEQRGVYQCDGFRVRIETRDTKDPPNQKQRACQQGWNRKVRSFSAPCSKEGQHRNQQRIFEHGFEKKRRESRGKDSAQYAPQCNPEVELRQILRIRSAFCQPRMTEQSATVEKEKVNTDHDPIQTRRSDNGCSNKREHGKQDKGYPTRYSR